MQLKQLEIFAQVARLRSFSKAAEALYLTQPTVSAHMSTLEQELGVRLVVRSTRELRLTPPGRVLETYATQILALCRRAEQEVRMAGTDVSGVLSIAASTVPAQYLLPRVLPLLRQQHPRVFFQVRQGDSSQAAQWMAEGGAELGIVGSPVSRPGLVCTPFLTERLAIITPDTPEYRALDGVMTPQVLRQAPFLVRESGSGTRKRAEEFLRSIGLDPRALHLAAQLESTESILQGVKNGLGISIVSGYAAEEGVQTGRFLAFDYDSPFLDRQFYLLHRKSGPLSPAAAMLLEALPAFFRGAEARSFPAPAPHSDL